MLVTELGIVIEVSDEQPLNACLPMTVTPLPIVTELRFVQSPNTFLPM